MSSNVSHQQHHKHQLNTNLEIESHVLVLITRSACLLILLLNVEVLPSVFIIPCGLVNQIWRHSAISLNVCFFMCLSFDPHLTTHQWNIGVQSRYVIKWHMHTSRYNMMQLWTLPNVQVISNVGSNWKLFCMNSQCKSQRLSFQVSESMLRCRSCKRSEYKFFFSLNDDLGFPYRVNHWTQK